jgi:hypothetical protein
MSESESPWLLLIHQIPPKPDYFRVKIWRRLQRLGAVAIKNSVYALPKNEQTQEDFQWVLREILAGGGDASLCEARFIEGLSSEEIQALFQTARESDYKELADQLRKLNEQLSSRSKADTGSQIETDLSRLKRRLSELVSIDFFGAPGREKVEGLLSGIERRMQGKSFSVARDAFTARERKELVGKTWVTRKGIYIDRIASAWLIRRFIDVKAQIKFVPAKGYKPNPGEIRFDMFEAEFTHEGDKCSFEVLVDRMGFIDPALKLIAEIIHDIDLKDSKFEREETTGIERLITGIAMAHKDDEVRLQRGAAVFDDLYEYFKRKHD